MKIAMPADLTAENITFGVEIECAIPLAAGVRRGGYHRGLPVTGGLTTAQCFEAAPTFNGTAWRADSDGSLGGFEANLMTVEFVSPVLHGAAGVQHLIDFIRWLNRLGAKVNTSCGLHITVGIRSMYPGKVVDSAEVARFVRRLARFANNHRWAIYAQTGTGRHVNRYSAPLTPETKANFERMLETSVGENLIQLATSCGRGMVNFRKAFNPGSEVVEFRAFAGTTNESKVLHHLATVFGICRKVVASKEVPPFFRSEKIVRLANAKAAVKRLWKVMGWSRRTATHDCALGLFGPLHELFPAYSAKALEMAEKFEASFPAANL
ncbi:MAG: amidoligase family protein [Verrucomicrobiota bacterium]